MLVKNSEASISENLGVRTPLTDRINVEPPILHGMAASEAKYIAAASGFVSLLVVGLLQVLTGLGTVLLIFAIVIPLLILWFSSIFLMKIKRGRPDGFYIQRIHLYLVKKSLAASKFVNHFNFWELGR